jgi:urease accessory protein
MQKLHLQLSAAVVLGGLSTAAMAHTGHGTDSFFAGLMHPWGADHLLAMLAVGLWSAFALPARRAWAGPATFLLGMAVGAALGLTGFRLPLLELGLAASVMFTGAMLAWAAWRAPAWWGLLPVALFAGLHGLAHGAEAPVAAAWMPYAAGFLITTAVLLLAALAAGAGLRRGWGLGAARLAGALGLAFAGTGMVLVGQMW